MGDFSNGSSGGSGAHFYSFDYTNYNPTNDGRAPPHPAASEHLFFPSMTGFSSGEGTFQTIHGSFNSRLRRISDFEPVKHKRSRNGCYTCRSRRVKCDEERPKCGRCSKSKRECVFPELPKNATAKEAPAKSSDEEPASPEQSESVTTSQLNKSESAEDWTTNDESQASLSQHASPHSENESTKDFPNIPQDVLAYMDYFEHHVSHHHYGFIDADEGNTLRDLLSQTIYYDEALMYAVVAFCAFLKTVASGRNSLEDFLGYYNTSMALLRQSLINNQGVSVTTLMTVLQLALLEEYLGDWVNLQSHQRAALGIITEMFTPESIVKDPSSRVLLHWYIRFDQFTAFISQNTTLLGIEWWEADRTLADDDLETQDEDRLVRLRCDRDLRGLSKDISILFTQSGQAPAAGGADMATLQNLALRLETWRNEFEAPLLQQAHIPISPDSPMPSSLPEGNSHDLKRMWAAKHLLVHLWDLQLIFQYLLFMATQQPPSLEFTVLAKRISELMQDIIENDPHPDAIIGIRGPLAISSIALGHDPERVTWCLDQLSNIESRGYLYPSTFRKHVPDMTGNVMEAETETQGEIKPMVQVVREWIEERTNDAHDLQSENIRQMAGIFGLMTNNS